ncbi:MAG: acetyl-CoA carboxylase, carboxyltransferase subunit beta [Nitrospirae bacterium]|nr:acetyl-CoA carboxylase, carboxyltransferase subunit beta [Nitrospirota bacterium]
MKEKKRSGWLEKKDENANSAGSLPLEAPESEKRVRIPEGLWIKCNHCRQIVYRKEVERAGKVCPKCNYHFPITLSERLEQLVDTGTFEEFAADVVSSDPLHFADSQRYVDRLRSAQKKTGLEDAIRVGECRIMNMPTVLGVFSFHFMGGSMGSVVGEKVVRAADRALEKGIPLILVTASGGARMQEGIFSLMQMARTSSAVGRLKKAGLPYLTVLTDPTFGGVTASFAMLGDIIIAEPRALIGFAGPRVIEQTIRQQLPEGFQRAEFLLEHGFVDMIVERKKLKETLAQILCHLGPGRKTGSLCQGSQAG